MSGKKVIRYKKRFRPNIALFIFLLILVYVAVLGWNYLTREHVSIYEVNTSEISDDSPLYGFILRKETVVTAEDEGYINYYNPEGSRVGVGDVVYTLDKSGEVSSMLEQIQDSSKSDTSISAMREEIAGFQNSFSPSSYEDVVDFKYDIENAIFEQSRDNLYANLNENLKQSGKSKNFTKITAKKSGVISYSVDGYEGMKQKDITPGLFEEYGQVTAKQLQSSDTVDSGSPAYKLITDNDWSLVVRLDDSYYEQLKTMDFVRVTIDKDDISFNASVKLFQNAGENFARLSTSRYLERYLHDRFLKIEFSLKSASGLKIPNSAILQKDFYVIPADIVTTGGNEDREGNGVVKQVVNEEGGTSYQFVSIQGSTLSDGNYYVSSDVISGGDILLKSSDKSTYIVSSKEVVSGVYCVNAGYCEFKPIHVIYQNKEYTIVSDDTKDGLAAYDHIVVDPAQLSDDDFIE